MTILQLLTILWARRGLLLFVFLITVALGGAVTAFWPKQYMAEASVVIDSKSSNPVSGPEQSADLLSSTMGTQVDVITSHNVALKVVDKLKLSAVPAFQEQYLEATGGQGSIRDWLAARLHRIVDVLPSKDSHVINIDIWFNEPAVAADLANAFADAYIQTSLELRMDPARRQAAWFEDQLNSLRRSLQGAQSKLSEYQKAKNVAGTSEQIDIENTRLAELSNQLISAQAVMYDRQNRLKQMNGALARDAIKELPDILGNSLLQELKAQLVQSESALAQMGEKFGKNHPQYRSAVAQTAALREKLAAEIETAKGSIQQSAEISVRQEGELRAALGKQKAKLLDLKHERDELDVLRHEVEDKQRAYDAGLQRAAQVRLESQLDQANIAVLNPAYPPLLPARPNPILWMAIAIFLGVIFALSVAITKEASDRLIRSSVDLTDLPGIVLLAEIPKTTLTRKQRRLLKRSNRPLLLNFQQT
jgi:polysaccharide biosynthesis transport protein